MTVSNISSDFMLYQGFAGVTFQKQLRDSNHPMLNKE
jgi:hypothetical protein